MKHFFGKTYFWASLAAIGLSALCGRAPCSAQPPTPPAEAKQDATKVASGWASLRKANESLEATDPRAAIAQYKQFYEASGNKNGAVAVVITSRIAQLYWQGLHDREKALEIYDWGLKNLSSHRDSERLRQERKMVQSGHMPGVAPIQLAPQVAAPPVPVKATGAPIAFPKQLSIPSPVPSSIKAPDQVKWNNADAPSLPTITLRRPVDVALVPKLSSPRTLKLPNLQTPKLPDASRSALQTVFLTQLQADRGNAETLWQNSGLTLDELLSLIENSDENDAAQTSLRLALAGLAAARDAKQLPLLEAWSLPVRLAVANYYASRTDKRAVVIYEDVLAKYKATLAPYRLVAVLEKLASYYATTGQLSTGAQIMARVEEFASSPALVGNSYVGAARLYRQAGDNKNADALYRKVIDTPSEWGWAKGLAMSDQANALFEQGRYVEARELLKISVSGRYADQIQVALLLDLANSYYLAGDLETSQKYYLETIAQYKSLANPLHGEGLDGIPGASEDVLQRIEQWRKVPFVSQAADFYIVFQHNKQQPIVDQRPLTIRSFRSIPLTVTSDNPHLKAHLVADKGRDDLDYIEEVSMEVTAEAQVQSFGATLTISSPQYPDYKIQVPVFVEMRAEDE